VRTFSLRVLTCARRIAATLGRAGVLAAFATAVAGAQSAPDLRYRITSTSVLSLDRAQQAPLVDTVVTSALLTIATSARVDTTATMSLDSLQVVSTGMIRRPPDAFMRGPSVAATLVGGRPRVTGDSATACASERPLAGLLPELLPLLPALLRADQQWSDTLTVTTCRAGLPVTTVTIANYHTLTGMDSTTILVERHAVIRAAGSSMVRQQTVTLTGSGTSESLAVLALSSRRLQSWRGTQTLEVQLTNGQQTRRMVQQLTDNAAMIP
jgi:hypothetical protein